MVRPVALALLVASVLSSTPASASEQSRRLYARGLVDFHAERYTKALELFDQSVQADPNDPYARYYRGVTRARLNDFTGAVADLREVLDKWKNFKQAQLELGVALVQKGEYRDAIPRLQQARLSKRLDGRASLFLGIAQLRLDQVDAARKNFERAEERDPSLRLAARYYQGVAAYREGKLAEAEDRFSYVTRTSPDSAMGREANTFLARIREEHGSTHQVYGAVGFQYDSNVVLAASDSVLKSATKTALGISNEADGRATINAGGVYVPFRNETVELALGYDFYQSLHFRLTDFNLQDHRPSVQVLVNVGPVQMGLLGRYDYYFLDTDSFLQEASALPWLAIPERNLGRTEIFYRMRRRDFFKQAFRIRDAFNHAAGIRQLVYLGSYDRYLSAGYRFDRDEPIRSAGEVFAYDGNEIDVGIGWALPAAVRAEAGYAYRHERYAAASNGRRDDVHEFVVTARKDLTEHLDVVGGYFGTLNNSNDPLFDYDRHVVSVALEVRF